MPYPGGIEIFAVKFLPAMRQRGYELAVITSHAELELPDRETYAGIPLYRLPFRAALTKRDLPQIFAARTAVVELKRAFAPDLIHLYALGPSALFHLQTLGAHAAPTLVTLHGEVLRGGADGGDTILEKVLSSAEWVSCVSHAVLEKACELTPDIAGHSSVDYLALEPSALAPAPLLFSSPRLLCLGRLVPQKGFDLALTAFRSIADKFRQASLVIAGEGLGRAALEEQARKLGLAERVEFTGWIAPGQVPALINTATVVLLPSRREGLPLVSLQAAQMARPTVAARVGGLPEIVIDGETGLLFDAEDSAALARAIEFLLEHPERAVQMGHAAVRRAESVFGWTHHLDNIESIYQKIALQTDIAVPAGE